MKIVVLVKQVPDTWEERKLDTQSGVLDRDANERVLDETNERALELALSYKDSHKGTEVVALSMGPEAVTQGLRKALSMGADSALHVQDDALAGADIGWTAEVLAAGLRRTGFDLVIAGNESTDGRGGVVPALIAEHLGLPHLTSLNSAEIAESFISGERGAEDGTLMVRASLPAVISITERLPEARFPSFRGIISAKKKPLTVLSLNDLQPLAAGGPGYGRSTVLTTEKRPARTAGKKILDEGNAGVELAEFLVAGRLI